MFKKCNDRRFSAIFGSFQRFIQNWRNKKTFLKKDFSSITKAYFWWHQLRTNPITSFLFWLFHLKLMYRKICLNLDDTNSVQTPSSLFYFDFFSAASKQNLKAILLKRSLVNALHVPPAWLSSPTFVANTAACKPLFDLLDREIYWRIVTRALGMFVNIVIEIRVRGWRMTGECRDFEWIFKVDSIMIGLSDDLED